MKISNRIILLTCFFYLLNFNLLELKANQNSLYNFMRITGSARTSSLSGAVVALNNEASGVFFNPAVVYNQKQDDFSVTFLKHVLDINSGNLVYNFGETFEEGKLAASINYTNYGSFEYADFNNRGGDFSGNDISFGVTYSNMIDSNFYFGVTPKFVFLTLEQSSSVAFALDGGLIYNLKDGRTSFGLSVLHAGTQISKLGNINESLPTDIRLGFNHRLKGLPILFNFSFVRMADKTDSFGDKLKNVALGAEIYLGKYIDVRAGFDNQIRSTTTPTANRGISGFSAGFGIKLEGLNVDYGFGQYGPTASLHRFTITSNLQKIL